MLTWAVGCLLGGLVCLLVGAHAAGLALLGSLVGASAGPVAVSSDLDAVAFNMTVGATIGAVLAGLGGLAWRPHASRSAMVSLGVTIVLTAVVGAVYVAVGGFGASPCRSYRAGCFPHVEGWAIALFAFDAAWILLLCFIQAPGSNERQRSVG